MHRRLFDSARTGDQHCVQSSWVMSELRLLSDGSHRVLVMASGHGCIQWGEEAITRRCADATRDDGGTRCLRGDSSAGADTSTAAQPQRSRPDACGQDFQKGHSTFWHRGRGIRTHTGIAVSPDDPMGLRRVVIANLCERSRTLGAPRNAEIVLAEGLKIPRIANAGRRLRVASHERFASNGAAGLVNEPRLAMPYAFAGHRRECAGHAT